MLTFTASHVKGDGRGKSLGSPTINLTLEDVPFNLEHGVHACFVQFEEEEDLQEGVLHFGERPTFHRPLSCEVHLLDKHSDEVIDTVTITVVGKLRDVGDYENETALKEQIAQDISQARAMLAAHATET